VFVPAPFVRKGNEELADDWQHCDGRQDAERNPNVGPFDPHFPIMDGITAPGESLHDAQPR
jgi:hypothetical protein